MSKRAHLLNLIVEQIREEGAYVLASPEDADYFRQFARLVRPPSEEPPPPVAPKVIVEPPPLPPPKKIVAEPPPKPAPQVEPPPKMEAASPSDFSSLRQILSIVAPELAILGDVPSDALARKIAERWKTKNQSAPISILSFQEPPEQKALLEQIAKAIDAYFGPAKLVQAEGIEKESQWGAFLAVADLKMVVVCDYTLWQLNKLMQFYKETPAQGARVLGNTPLFLLPDLSLYLKDPSLKRSLWKALCQKCS